MCSNDLRLDLRGEVGRGTFVRAAGPAPVPALAEPTGAKVDLELSYPRFRNRARCWPPGWSGSLRPDVLDAALGPGRVTGTPPPGRPRRRCWPLRWRPAPESVLFAGNGRQAIAGAVSALVPPGGRLAVEALTYPVIKGIAARLGVTLVPVAADEHGLRPDALADAHRAAPLGALYLQPTLHNPHGTTMPWQRRVEIAAALERLGLDAIEDRVWAFLPEDGPQPLASPAARRTVLVDSLSKRLAPGLSLGFAVPPAALAGRVAAALRSGAWGPRASRSTRRPAGSPTAPSRRSPAPSARTPRPARRSSPNASRAPSGPGRPRTSAGGTCRRSGARRRSWRRPPGAASPSPRRRLRRGNGRRPRAVRIGLASPPLETLSHALTVLADLATENPDDIPLD